MLVDSVHVVEMTAQTESVEQAEIVETLAREVAAEVTDPMMAVEFSAMVTDSVTAELETTTQGTDNVTEELETIGLGVSADVVEVATGRNIEAVQLETTELDAALFGSVAKTAELEVAVPVTEAVE